jgi:hypothetical protein
MKFLAKLGFYQIMISFILLIIVELASFLFKHFTHAHNRLADINRPHMRKHVRVW